MILIVVWLFSILSSSVLFYVTPEGKKTYLEGKIIDTLLLEDAFVVVQPGDRIKVLPGVYEGMDKYILKYKTGTENNTIVIEGSGKESIFDGKVYHSPYINKSEENDPWGTQCVYVHDSEWIIFENLFFQNCWRSAITFKDSRYVTVRKTSFEGSQYVVLFSGMKSHHVLVEDCHWVQDPFGRVFYDVDWTFSHDDNWYNGGLLRLKETPGGVVFRRNKIVNAYKAFKGDQIYDLVTKNRNSNVEIYENEIHFIRDVGFKTGYDGWSHNYCMIAFQCIIGGGSYVFANTGLNVEIPPEKTTHYIAKTYKLCGYDDFEDPPKPSIPIYVFGNSFRLSNPEILDDTNVTANFYHYNNAYEFTDPYGSMNGLVWDQTLHFDNDLSNIGFSSWFSEHNQEKNGRKGEVNFFNSLEADFRIDSKSPAAGVGKLFQIPSLNYSSSDEGVVDIGAYNSETKERIKGPTFRVASGYYPERPRIVRTEYFEKEMWIYFSDEMDTNCGIDNCPVVTFDDGKKIYPMNFLWTKDNYAIRCTYSQDIMNLLYLQITGKPKSTQNEPFTLWASVDDKFIQ